MHRVNRELPVAGFGVADFVWVAWTSAEVHGEGKAISASKQVPQPNYQVAAFEMKLTGWTRGFSQACRYRFFAHRSFLVLPPRVAALAKKKLDLFTLTGVGLLSYDMSEDKIVAIHSPRAAAPRSDRAYKAALKRIGLTP